MACEEEDSTIELCPENKTEKTDSTGDQKKGVENKHPRLPSMCSVVFKQKYV